MVANKAAAAASECQDVPACVGIVHMTSTFFTFFNDHNREWQRSKAIPGVKLRKYFTPAVGPG